jgi:glycosyltransferase involved in cell wall biosynthesis
MSQPVLSIISPVLNKERYLAMFLQSVIDQHCPKVEHVIIDGCSQDNSVKIIEEFARKYPHIRWISEKDSGVADAVNKGIALARGTFITILCLNDFYEPNTLNEVVELLPTLPQGAFLVGNCRMLNERDELLYVNRPEAFTPLQIMLNKPFPYNPVSYFYRKDLHQKVGLYQGGDDLDLDFLLRVFKVAKVHYVDKSWGNFRLWPDSTTFKTMQAGKIGAQIDKVFEQHLKTYPVFQRILFKIVITLNKRTKLIYFFERIAHYFRNPKDIIRFLKDAVRFIRKKSG